MIGTLGASLFFVYVFVYFHILLSRLASCKFLFHSVCFGIVFACRGTFCSTPDMSMFLMLVRVEAADVEAVVRKQALNHDM
jgi:hypothetical protein